MNKAGVLAFTFAAAGLIGCALDQPNESSTEGMSFEEFKARAGREPGTGAYVLDWDMVIHGDDALFDYWSRYQQGALTIYTVGGVNIKWDATQKKNLTYCVGAGFGATNKQLVIDAMNGATALGWEKFADVKFVYVPGQDATCTAANTTSCSTSTSRRRTAGTSPARSSRTTRARTATSSSRSSRSTRSRPAASR